MGNALHTPGAPGVGAVGPADARLDDAGLVAVQGPSLITPRTGVMHGPGSTTLVTATADTAPMTVAIGPHHWVTNRGSAADGVYRGAAEVLKKVSLAAAPGSGTRTDTIWVKQNDQYSTITPDGSTAVVYGVTAGTPGKQPIPVGAEELATVAVPAGVTRSDAVGVTITNTAKQTVARGARIPVRSQAERDALTAFKGLEVYRLDTGQVQLSDGSTWATTYDPAATPGCELSGTGGQTVGTGTWSTILWPTEVADPRDMHSTTVNTHRITVPVAGFYVATAVLYWGSSSTGRRGVRFNRNSEASAGTTTFEDLRPAAVNARTSIAAGMWLTAGQFVCVQGFQDSGANLDVSVDISHFSLVPAR